MTSTAERRQDLAAGRRSAAAETLLMKALDLEGRAEFEAARRTYRELTLFFPIAPETQWASRRIQETDLLIAEKALYERIHQNAKLVLSRVGMNIAGSPELLYILMQADAVDLDNTEACLVPLKADYVERCLETVPDRLPADPGRNSFGTGGTPPFLKRESDDELRAAGREEFEEIIRAASRWSDVVGMLSAPVRTDHTMTDYDCALLMEREFPGLKMICTQGMSDRETSFLSGKDHWLDGTSLMSSLAPMNSVVSPFIRSVSSGNNLLLLDFSIAGASAPRSPEGLLTLVHAEVLFMMVLAQTLRPGTVCVHGGIPGLMGPGGDLTYSSPVQALVNAAMARLNLWVTGFPSAQSGGSTSLADDLQGAVFESARSRGIMRRCVVHMVRHALGAMGNLTYFSPAKFLEDCRQEAFATREYAAGAAVVPPLHLPADDSALEGIREMAEKGNPMVTDHSLRHVDSFRRWEELASGPEGPLTGAGARPPVLTERLGVQAQLA